MAAKNYTGYDSPFYSFDEAPLNKEALISHAKDLALTHRLKKCRKTPDKYLPNLSADKELLEKAYKTAHESVKEGWEIDPVSEWFIDNYYLLEEQLKQLEIKDSRKRVEIPCIKGGVYDGYPRVFVLAAEIMMHMEARLSEDLISDFLNAYQSVSPLSMKELWLFPEMLMVALLKAAAGVAVRSLNAYRMRLEAKRTAEILEKKTKKTFKEFLVSIFSPENKEIVKNSTYIKTLYTMLRDEPKNADALLALDKRLAREDLTAEKLIRLEHGRQAKNQAVIANTITSVRMLSRIYWEDLFERLSVVDGILRDDEVYTKMDFDSRDYYRKTIEKIASYLRLSEAAVAKEAIRLKNEAGESPVHVGYFILGEGREALFRAFSETPPQRERLSLFFMRHRLGFYSGTICISAFLINLGVFYLMLLMLRSFWPATIGAFFTYLPVYGVIHQIANQICMKAVKPAFIPKMDYAEGIPAENRTIAVVSALVSDEKNAVSLLEDLEVYYIANQDENLFFGLLGDFRDADQVVTEEELAIVSKVEEKVRELNLKYGREIFYYYHRKRQYIADENKYMGDERKRGALLDLCAVLKGSKKEGFLNSEIRVPEGVKYVITMDADTQIPRDAAKKLIGAMAHPLNRPVVNEEGSAVIKGYGIMQPRIGIDVVSAAKTYFSLVFSGQAGLDTYSTACSDIYQDLFGEGIYTGKGIFDLDVFYSVLDKSFPKRRILSHDLLEGSYLRTALLTDVVFVDSYPSKYDSWAKRQHRWVRGDWQIIGWLFKNVRNEKSEKIKNPINRLSKFKISDNIGRSLIEPACFIVLFLGMTFLHRAIALLLFVGLMTLFYGPLSGLFGKIIVLIKNADKGVVLKDAWFETRNSFRQSFFKLSFLPYEAYLNMDAIVRTLYRLLVSKKKMLEWVTAAESEKQSGNTQKAVWRKMAFSPVTGMAVLLLSSFFLRTVSIPALLLGAAWFFAPAAAFITSQPIEKRKYTQDEETTARLRMLARKTWRFFEDFCTEDTFMWAPDNFQEYPYKKPVDRTSSTNIAFSLIANAIARDFGYITLGDMIDRMEKCVESIEKCRKWHGHLYNWYDLNTLDTLKPEYVSSVDSGNLACYLITAMKAVEDAVGRPVYHGCAMGLYDTQWMEAKKNAAGAYPPPEERDSAALFYDALAELEKEAQHEKHGNSVLKKSVEAFLREAERLTPFLKLIKETPASARDGEYEESARALLAALDRYSPAGFVEEYHAILNGLSILYKRSASRGDGELVRWIKEMELKLGTAYINSRKLLKRAALLIERMKSIFEGMDFSTLYDEKKGLFSIGYNIKEGSLSNSYYDLLASEARQTGFIAIAKGDVPQKHWFRLSRPLAVLNERRVLLSWGGTMFEYCMPLLLMKNYEYTLLDETYSAVVEAQKMFGDQRHVPWGVSESGYYAFDLNLYYQYKAFGVQKLGLKSGLSKDTVISPYSTCLALLIDPALAVKNMEELKKAGAYGKYGFYEALDYTHERTLGREKKHIVKSYMAHHQGMILAALSNFLSENYLQRLFHEAPIVKATELLLKEKIPARNIVIKEYEHQAQEADKPVFKEIRALRKFSMDTALYPEAHLLSNGRYTCCLTQYGSGFSSFNGILLNRWNSDFMREFSGVHLYLSEEKSGQVWSAGFLPLGIEPEEYSVSFDAHKAEYARKDRYFKTTTEICVSPEADLEIRRVTVVNESGEDRLVKVTCAIEPVLCPKREYDAHPAFTEVFLQNRELKEQRALSVKRRKRRAEDLGYSLVLKAVCDSERIDYETNRERFFGRQNEYGIPAALSDGRVKSETGTETVLAMTVELSIPKKEKKTVSFVISAGESEADAVCHAMNLSDDAQVLRVMDLAWTHSQVEMRFLGLKHSQANVYQMIASRMIFHTPVKAKYEAQVRRNTQDVSALWQYGVSGDLPVVLFIIDDPEDMKRAKDIVLAHEFWRLKGFRADLVILAKRGGEYLSPLNDKLLELAQASHARETINKPGGLYILSADHIGDATTDTLISAASVVLHANEPFMKQILFEEYIYPHKLFPGRSGGEKQVRQRHRAQILENGMGGFTNGGADYTAVLREGVHTPAPWSNILTNGNFGSLVTMEGGGYSWAHNARMMRLTPFRNDPLKDIPGEGVLLRDDDTGEAFSLMPGMVKEGEYAVTFGHGYALYERRGSLSTRLAVFTDTEENVKASLAEIANERESEKNLSLFYFMEPVLGEHWETAERSVVAGMDALGALTARNAFSNYPGIAFLYAKSREVFYTARKEEFFGIYGSVHRIAALNLDTLSNSLGGGSPCLALQLKFTVAPGGRAALPLLMGYAKDEEEMRLAIAKFDTPEKLRERLQSTRDFWAEKLNRVKVRTPSIKFDTIINHWLLYQVYAARMYGRTGYYQSGGAFGFRDQLQDVLSMLYTDEKTARDHILKCASRQFIEGDVLHWWHDPTRGVRTYIRDDLLFLPYTACIYAKVTGDYAVFEEKVPYLESVPIPCGQEDLYMEFLPSDESETLYLHCVRAIEHSLDFGERGLAKIGSGDWCDGMNHVGIHGKGESVWLSFFLYDVLNKFAEVSGYFRDGALMEKYRRVAAELYNSIEQNAWDGKWYRRAYFDDGTPLGSAQNGECTIDLLTQAWPAIADCGSKQRQIEAYNSAMNKLVKTEDGLICLFTPPFDQTESNPGYVRGYRPGIRENGGQYTHASAWHIIAASALKRKNDAYSLFELINPVNNTSTAAGLQKYRGEPYVMAGDVSSSEGIRGRAGWTWYTGSASWMYQAGVKSILGMYKEGEKLYIEPCIPEDWPNYRLNYRYRETDYAIHVVNPYGHYKGRAKLTLDGYYVGEYLHLADDAAPHEVKAELLPES
jgi:cyclic beta-1,2-glucan synthetase